MPECHRALFSAWHQSLLQRRGKAAGAVYTCKEGLAWYHCTSSNYDKGCLLDLHMVMCWMCTSQEMHAEWILSLFAVYTRPLGLGLGFWKINDGISCVFLYQVKTLGSRPCDVGFRVDAESTWHSR